MCAVLMKPAEATTAELQAAVDRKIAKFGSIEAMPSATAYLVQKAIVELNARAD